MSSTFSKNTEKVLENALRLAESFGHTYVGSDHLLLALAEDKNSRLAEMLARCDIDSEKIKNVILYYYFINWIVKCAVFNSSFNSCFAFFNCHICKANHIIAWQTCIYI